MKYIKLFEGEKRNYINLNMIMDIKDMSLEYLDDGMILNITIIERSYPYSNFYIAIEYSHDNEIIFGDDFNYSSEFEFGYSIRLTDKLKSYMYVDETSELIDRIRIAYPNEKIKQI